MTANTDYVPARDGDSLVKASSMAAAFNRYHELYLNDKETVMHYKGSVTTAEALPTAGNKVGDIWNIADSGENVAWTEDTSVTPAVGSWDYFGTVLDLSDYTGNVNITGNISATGTISSSSEVVAYSTDLQSNTVTHALTQKLDEEDYRSGLTWDELRARYTWEDLSGATATATTTLTSDLGLTKATGPIDISVINNNFDILDAAHEVTVSPGTASAAATSIDQVSFKDNNIWKGLDEVRLYNGTDALYCKEGVTTGLLMQGNQIKVVPVSWNAGVPAVGTMKGYIDANGDYHIWDATANDGEGADSTSLATLRDSVSKRENIYEAAWTGTSSNALHVQMTEKITLPPGTYLIIMNCPTCSTDVYFRLRNSDYDGYNNTIMRGQTDNGKTSIITLTEQKDVWIASFSTGSATYSSLNEGGLWAWRIK